MSLCNGIVDLGWVRTCGTVTTGMTASSTGDYTIRMASTEATVTVNIISGNAIAFSNVFNDDSEHIFQVLDPSNNLLSYFGSTCFKIEVRSRTYINDSFSDAALGNCLGASSGAISVREEFTTNGSGAATVVALSGKNVDLFTYVDGGANVLLGEADYTFVSGTGAFSGLDPSKKYLAYAY